MGIALICIMYTLSIDPISLHHFPWNMYLSGMGAPVGNEFYKMVQAPTGRPPVYLAAQDLWLKAVEYFLWVNDNPLYEVKAFGTGLQVTLPKMRAMTENAFQLWAGISKDTFLRMKKGQYGSNESDSKDFCEVSGRICDIIYQQKFEGAAADFLNANIIGRELGLSDKQELNLSGAAIQIIMPPDPMPDNG